MKKTELLIIGQGLAGSCLINLIKDRDFLVIDKGLNYSSSFNAGGLVNPIIFKRLNKSYRVDFYKYAYDFYKEFNSDLLVDKEIIKIFNSDVQKKDFLIKAQEDNTFLSNEIIYDIKNLEFKYGLKIKNSFYIKIKNFLKETKLKFKDKIIKDDFDISLVKNKIFKDIKFDKLILCCGYLEKNIDKAFKKVLGDIILIESNLNIENPLNFNNYLIPYKKNQYLFGASYVWDNEEINAFILKNDDIYKNKYFKQKRDIRINNMFKNFNNYVKCDYTIKEINTSIRPSSLDRRPILGQIAKDIYIFNGLGTKGIALAPKLASLLLDHIYKNENILQELDSSRFI